MPPAAPLSSKAITIKGPIGQPGKVYYDLNVSTLEVPNPSPSQLLITLHAASLNHRDVFIRQHLYPGISFSTPLCADGVGTAVPLTSASPSTRAWHSRRVIIHPETGWDSDPRGPESSNFAMLGGTKGLPSGTLQERIVVDAKDVEDAPEHLSDAEAAALPLTGLTAWRAVWTKGGVGPGKKVLVTGIGGGVALMALLFATSLGAEVWVSSGIEEKVERAKSLGAKGGVIYKEEGWEKKLLKMAGGELDVIIDGAGGDIVAKSVRLLRPGGLIVSYGMTLGPVINFPMSAVLKNIELRGSTMGSRAEFHDMVAFVRDRKIRPVVSRTVKTSLDDLEAIDGLFEDMKHGRQFGKLVVEMEREGGKEGSGNGNGSKL